MVIRLITGRLQQGSRIYSKAVYNKGVLSAIRSGKTIDCNVYRMEFSVKFVVLSHSIYSFAVNGRCRRMAMLSSPLHYGLYSMAWTVVAGWR